MAPQTKPDYFASYAELRHKFPAGDNIASKAIAFSTRGVLR